MEFVGNSTASNLCAVYFEIAAKNQRLPAFISDRGTVDHHNFSKIVQSFVVRLLSIGVSKSSIVAFRTEDLMVSLALVLATSWIGAGLVVATDSLLRSGLVRPTHFLKSRSLTSPHGVPFIDIDQTWFSVAEDWSDVPFSSDVSAPRSSLFLTSSGTSGKEKIVQVSHNALWARVVCRREEFHFRHSVLASAASATSRLLWARALPVLLQAGALAVGYSPRFWLDAGVTRVVGSPQQVIYLFKGLELPRRFECLEVGGAPLNTHMIELFLRHFDKVIDSYGAVETSKSYENVYRQVGNTTSVEGRSIDSDFEIVDEGGKSVPVGTPGNVRVRNGHMADGYLYTTGLAAVCREVDGWFYPGDIAAWGGDGTLKVLGRIDQVVNIGGTKVVAGELEAYVNEFAYVLDAAAVQFLDVSGESCFKILVEMENEDNLYPIFDNICRYAAKEKGIFLNRDNFLAAPQIPRNENGKIDIVRCISLVQSQSGSK